MSNPRQLAECISNVSILMKFIQEHTAAPVQVCTVKGTTFIIQVVTSDKDIVSGDVVSIARLIRFLRDTFDWDNVFWKTFQLDNSPLNASGVSDYQSLIGDIDASTSNSLDSPRPITVTHSSPSLGPISELASLQNNPSRSAPVLIDDLPPSPVPAPLSPYSYEYESIHHSHESLLDTRTRNNSLSSAESSPLLLRSRSSTGGDGVLPKPKLQRRNAIVDFRRVKYASITPSSPLAARPTIIEYRLPPYRVTQYRNTSSTGPPALGEVLRTPVLLASFRAFLKEHHVCTIQILV